MMLKTLKRFLPRSSSNNRKSNSKTKLPGKGKSTIKVGDYDPSLIPSLEHQHDELLEHYSNILQFAKKGKTAAAKYHLGKMRLDLSTHLLTENHLLYSYMSKNLKDPVSRSMAHSFKEEMDGIGKDVMAFLTAYTRDEAVIDDSFIRQLEKIGAALAARIEQEQSKLYKLYKPV